MITNPVNLQERLALLIASIWGGLQLVEINLILETIILIMSMGLGVLGFRKHFKEKDK